jgi:hypothetical protein
VLLVVPKARPAAASPANVAPSPKRPKKSRRAVADMQFAADVHRSILCCMRAHEDGAMAIDSAGDAPDVLREQDRALADRLSKGLRDQGCSPVLIEGSGAYALPSVEITKVDVAVSLPESDAIMHAVDAAGRTADAAPLAIDPCMSGTAASLPSTSAQSPRSPTPSPSVAIPAPGSRVYEMPQLIAALHMRRHERAARTRPQSSPASRTRARTPSPLAAAFVVTAGASDL